MSELELVRKKKITKPRKLTTPEKRENKKLYDKTRRATSVNIKSAVMKWTQLRDENGMNNEDFALFLLNR